VAAGSLNASYAYLSHAIVEGPSLVGNPQLDQSLIFVRWAIVG
jgi:hypothetical protein